MFDCVKYGYNSWIKYVGRLPTKPVPIRDKNLFRHNSSCSIHRLEHPKYLLLQLKSENVHCLNNNQSFRIFFNAKPVLQKAWLLVPNYFQPLCKEGHWFLEDDIFLNKRKINLSVVMTIFCQKNQLVKNQGITFGFKILPELPSPSW